MQMSAVCNASATLIHWPSRSTLMVRRVRAVSRGCPGYEKTGGNIPLSRWSNCSMVNYTRGQRPDRPTSRAWGYPRDILRTELPGLPFKCNFEDHRRCCIPLTALILKCKQLGYAFYPNLDWLSTMTGKEEGLRELCPAQGFVFERTHCPHTTEPGPVGLLEIAPLHRIYRAGHRNNGAADNGSHLAQVIIIYYFIFY